MNQEATAAGDERSESFKRLLPFGHAAVLAVVLFATTVVAVLVFSLRSDVAALEDQARKAAKEAKAVGAELAAIKADLDGPQAAPAPVAAAPAAAPRAPGPVLVGYGGTRPGTPGAPIPVCVFQAGDPHGLADCIKRGIARKNRS